MTTLSDILDVGLLEKAIKEKLVKVVKHPTLPLRIYNYTPIAQYKNEWTTEVMASRGLIIGPDDEIIARGPSKFFNYGQPGAPEVSLDQQVIVSRKEDGSLGIGWYYDGHYGVATRGSFMSDQAIHATALLSDNDKQKIKFYSEQHNRTEIFEIVYPDNRIVLDYGDLDKLIHLGQVDNGSGFISHRNLGILFDSERVLNSLNVPFRDALELSIPDDEEGYVVDIISDGRVTGHIKLKGERYKHLHAAIYGLSARKIWEYFCEGEDATLEFIADLPDELQPWASSIHERLRLEFSTLLSFVEVALADVKGTVSKYNPSAGRKELALCIKSKYPNLAGPIFAAFDGHNERVTEWILKEIKPGHELFRTVDEDAN